MDILQLCDDVYYIIFNQLDPDTLLSCREVCQSWCNIIKETSYNKKVKISSMYGDKLVELLQICLFRKLQLRDCLVNDEAIPILCRLDRLDLGDTPIPEKKLDILREHNVGIYRMTNLLIGLQQDNMYSSSLDDYYQMAYLDDKYYEWAKSWERAKYEGSSQMVTIV